MLNIKEDIGQIVVKKTWADQLISQDHLWPKINESIQRKQFPHFSLLLGRPGNGQLIMALSVAQALLCKSEKKPCGNCDACYKVQHCIHPDLHFSFPLNNPKVTCQQYYKNWRQAISEKPFMSIIDWFGYLEGESKNANISVLEINNLIGLLHLKPFEAASSVLILWLPEYLGKDSNRLLKLLEEPPPNVFIILVSENSDLLLSTVRSRAQVYYMQSIQQDEAAKVLAEQFNVDINLSYSSLLSVNGNIQEAISQLKEQNIPFIEVLRKLLQSTFTYNLVGMIEWTGSFLLFNKEEQKKFLQWNQNLLSFIIKIKYTQDTRFNGLENSMVQYASKLSGTLSISQIELWTSVIDDTYIAIQRNGNMKIVMADFTIKLSHILRNTISNN